jgi:hypothetical protein
MCFVSHPANLHDCDGLHHLQHITCTLKRISTVPASSGNVRVLFVLLLGAAMVKSPVPLALPVITTLLIMRSPML